MRQDLPESLGVRAQVIEEEKKLAWLKPLDYGLIQRDVGSFMHSQRIADCQVNVVFGGGHCQIDIADAVMVVLHHFTCRFHREPALADACKTNQAYDLIVKVALPNLGDFFHPANELQAPARQVACRRKEGRKSLKFARQAGVKNLEQIHALGVVVQMVQAKIHKSVPFAQMTPR